MKPKKPRITGRKTDAYWAAVARNKRQAEIWRQMQPAREKKAQEKADRERRENDLKPVEFL